MSSGTLPNENLGDATPTCPPPEKRVRPQADPLPSTSPGPASEPGPRFSVPIPIYRRGAVVAYAAVDAEDALLTMRHRWHLSAAGYAIRHVGRTVVRLHRVLLGLQPGDPIEGDHINRIRLDNTRPNLRALTAAQQTQNVSSRRGSSSRFRGVAWSKSKRKWQVQVKLHGRGHHIGSFMSEEAAADAAAEARARLLPFSAEALSREARP